MERDLSTQKKALMAPLFKITSVNRKSVEESLNFLKASGGISYIRDTGNYLKVWTHLFEAKEAFLEIRMAQKVTPELKKLLRFCAGRVPVILHTFLYRALKLM